MGGGGGGGGVVLGTSVVVMTCCLGFCSPVVGVVVIMVNPMAEEPEPLPVEVFACSHAFFGSSALMTMSAEEPDEALTVTPEKELLENIEERISAEVTGVSILPKKIAEKIQVTKERHLAQ